MDELYYHSVLISINNPDDHDLIDEMVASFESYILEQTRPYYANAMTVENQYSKIEA